MVFQKAVKKKAKLRLGLGSPAGGGKTYSAILIALGIASSPDKICFIDTEQHSGDLYCNLGDEPYNIDYIDAPYTPEKYIAKIKEAEDFGAEVIIIDSLTHAWAGAGGLLERQADLVKASKNSNSYYAWRDITPVHNKLVNAMLQSKCHIIATMRSKVEYVVGDDKKVKKLGLSHVQREGMDYEFTVVLDIDKESHLAFVSTGKDRTGLFDGQPPEVISVETGRKLYNWLNEGEELASLKKEETIDIVKRAFMKEWKSSRGKVDPEVINNYCMDKLSKNKEELTVSEWKQLIETLK